MFNNSFNLKSSVNNNPSKKLQKLKNKEYDNEPVKKPQYPNMYLNHDNDQQFCVNDEDMSLFNQNQIKLTSYYKTTSNI